MKKGLLLFLVALALYSPMVKGQTFSVQADTVYATTSTTVSLFDTIVAPTSISLKWKVIASTFPTDWLVDTVFGLCDANLCRPNSGGQLWSGTFGTSFTCTYPGTGNSHNYDLQMDLTNTTSNGTHYVTVSMNDPVTAYSRTMTFVVTKPGPSAVTNVNSTENEINLYPNPARNELNVVCSAGADVKTIAVYNIIGKVMMVYKVNGDSANMNLENIPSGIYFVRLTNSHGDVVVTRKFTKQ